MLIRLTLVSLALVGCDTSVVVYFDVDPAIAWEELVVTVHDENGGVVATPSVARGVELPVSIELEPGQTSRRFLLLADLRSTAGCDTDECRLERQRVLGTYGESGGSIRVRFDAECVDRECGGGHTCIEGTCRGACFAPSEGEGRSEPAPCEVFVDGARGEHDPELCVLEARPCASLRDTLEGYSVPRPTVDEGAPNCYGKALSLESGPIVSVRGTDDGGAQIEYGALDIRCTLSGTPDEPLVVRAWPGTGRPLLRGDLPLAIDSGNRTTENVVIEGLEATGGRVRTKCPDCATCTTGYEGWGVRVVGRNRNIVLRDLFVHDNEQGGIQIAQSPSAVSIVDSVVRHNRRENECFDGGFGVLANGPVTDLVIRGNTLSGNAGRGIMLYAPGEIVGNTIAGNQIGIEVRSGGTIRGNSICDNGTRGIVVGGTGEAAVSHNSVAGHEMTGIWFVSSASGVAIDNVVAGTGTTGVLLDSPGAAAHHNLIDGYTTPLDPPSDGNFIEAAGRLSFADRAACDLRIENYDPAWVPETGERVGAEPVE